VSNTARSILIIEDSPEDAEVFVRHLERQPHNMSCTIASSGEIGREMLLMGQFDCVLLDHNLPDMSGLEFLNTFAPDGAACAVVMLTGVGDETLAVAAMQAGAEDYLVKASLTPSVLLKAIDKAIERFALHRNLEREQRRNTVILESISDAFFSLDHDGRFTYANPASQKLINLDVLALIGQHWSDVFRSEQGVHFQDEIARATLENRSAHFEIVIDERDLWLEVRAYCSEEGIAVYATDIRERKRSEERMRSINEAQRRFVSDASHELRAPLTSISGNLDLLIRYPNMPSEDRMTALQDASDETWRMSRLVNDLLTLARGENGQPRLELLALEDILESAWRVACLLSDHRQFILGGIEPSMVLGNADAIKQLVVILLENAVKYTPDGGTVRLGSKVIGACVEFSVTDDGTGIPMDDQPHVFERFYRSDRSRSRGADPGGSGLGLTIAKRIVEIHGGEIGLESALGSGTNVTVRLPLAPVGQ
jgi:PAS domain S-box-containing protein